MGYTDMLFCTGDQHLDPMTSTHKLDLDVLKIYLHTKLNFLRQGYQNGHCKQSDRQTDTRTDRQREVT